MSNKTDEKHNEDVNIIEVRKRDLVIVFRIKIKNNSGLYSDNIIGATVQVD